MIGILIFSVVSLVTYFVVNRWKRRRIHELAAKLPGHSGLSFLASIYKLLTTQRKDYLSTIISYALDSIPMTKVWFLNKLLIVTKDADFINKVFNSQKFYDKPKIFYQGFLVEKGLIAMSGSEHRKHRKILNKAFSSKMLEMLPKIFDEKSKKILELMEEVEGCGEFELTDYVGAFSFESFGKSNLNYEIEYFQSEIFHAYEGYCSLIIDTLPFLIMRISRKFINLTKLGRKLKEVERKFDKFFDNVRKTNGEIANNVENTIVDLLFDPKHKFDEQDIREELIMTMLGAFETTTRTISTALMMLGMHKDVQQKAVKEIEEIYCHESIPEFTNDFLQKFSYLELILKETMRLFAVAPIVARETSDEVNINGYLIPKNTSILISINAMHRDEKYWGSDAHLFRPERFIDGPTNPHAFAPFTGGSRICIGNRYAMISMKIFLINFLRKYQVNCSTKLEDLKTEMTFTLNFLNGYNVSILRKQ